jgi:hypothetical protein
MVTSSGMYRDMYRLGQLICMIILRCLSIQHGDYVTCSSTSVNADTAESEPKTTHCGLAIAKNQGSNYCGFPQSNLILQWIRQRLTQFRVLSLSSDMKPH